MQEALKTFKEYLTSNNLKLTQQRLLIFKVFMSNEEKLSSDKLLRAVQELDIRISRSTVYRTVKHLLNSGIARCIQRGDGSTHYESMGDHHSQMICERCGKRYPISNPYIDCLQQETARQQGFTMFSFQTQIHGICNQCTPSETEREIASEHHVPPKMKQGV
ncbi:Fur family transcriptional regulator [Pseudodesulfovibrio piezophilus]|uniref:Ferric uptake regulation protein n=1 Tax=Pseudodesulfovibrio piezophilus (strain DSM 21447 / JCM 15486 / C1TLV30) TaxID=1322246 RepID=M1WKT6_PSEP2|nr:transcriptional repressor [Pseudodesulfovibrio piezophilus]CCH50166.1 Ferric uptake regulator, Fur family [Pseudodesulfovibrio piezophilus C1TLV30]